MQGGRKSGIELLRIIAMLMIIAHHFALHTNWPVFEGFSSNTYWIEILKSFGKIGAGLFFIITGYFMTERPNTIGKLLKISIPVWFYSILIFIIFYFSGSLSATGYGIRESLARSFIPILTNSYWFISSYIVLEIIKPYLARMLNAVSGKELLIMFFVYIIFCWEAGAMSYFALGTYQPIITLPAAILYAIIGYHLKNHSINQRRLYICGLLSMAVLLVFPVLSFNLLRTQTSLVWQFDSPFSIIVAVSLFNLFLNLKIKCRAINYIAGLTFGIYLIHDNFLIRRYLWSGNSLGVSMHFSDSAGMFIVYSAVMVALIFITCAIIEAVRRGVFNAIGGLVTFYCTRRGTRN